MKQFGRLLAISAKGGILAMLWWHAGLSWPLFAALVIAIVIGSVLQLIR